MFEQERIELIKTLRAKGITNERVLEAIYETERHLFVPEAVRHHAYNDTALPIGFGQTISQPYTVAIMTQELDVQEDDKVLEIGTGSGYQAAILVKLGAKVYSIERNMEIYNRALKLFDTLNIRAALRCSDGTIGWEEFAPFNKIIVTAGSPKIPNALKKQLAVGGKLVIPIGDRKGQTITTLTKLSDEEFSVKELPFFSFVPLIGREGWKE